MGDKLTMLEVARLTGLHKNTVRNYIQRGVLKAELVDEGLGKQAWVIDKDYLYNCGVPQILERLGPQDVEQRVHKQEASELSVPDKYIEELLRVTRELVSTQSELTGLRVQVPMLQAAQVERDHLKEEKEALAAELVSLEAEKKSAEVEIEAERVKAQVLEQALAEARANAKWSWRRRMAKASAGG